MITDNTRPHYLDNKKVYHHKKTYITGASDEGLDLDLLHGRETWIKRYMLVDLALFSGFQRTRTLVLKGWEIPMRFNPHTSSKVLFSGINLIDVNNIN